MAKTFVKKNTPHKVTLACYLIKVRELNNTETYLNIDTLGGNGNFEQFIKDFFDSMYSVDKNEERKKTVQLDTNNFTLNIANRKISGIIKSGEYGSEGNIIDSDTGEIKYKKKADEADEKPFYFLLHFPENKDEAIIILQRTGNLGIVDVVNYKLRNFLKKKYNHLTLEFQPLVTKELMNLFMNESIIRKVTLTKYILPSDVATKVRKKDHDEKPIAMELSFRAPRGGMLDRKIIKKFVEDPNTKIFSIKGIKQLGFDNNYSAAIQVIHNGNVRTVDLTDTGQVRPYYDVHDEIEQEKSGHPNFISINTSANKLLNDLVIDLYPIK